MSKTLDMLRAEHEVMDRLLGIVEQQVDLFEKAEPTDYDLMKEIVDYFLTVPDLYHHPKEDLIYVRLRRRTSGDMHDIPAEHEHVSERLHAFSRALISVLMDEEYPREQFVEIARKFLDGERRHMSGEEREFFPLAQDVLTDEDWMEIDARVSRFKDPLMHGDKTYRFQAIREQLDG